MYIIRRPYSLNPHHDLQHDAHIDAAPCAMINHTVADDTYYIRFMANTATTIIIATPQELIDLQRTIELWTNRRPKPQPTND